MINITPVPLYPRKRTRVPIQWKAFWAPEPVRTFWKREKFITSLRIKSKCHRFVFEGNRVPISPVIPSTLRIPWLSSVSPGKCLHGTLITPWQLANPYQFSTHQALHSRRFRLLSVLSLCFQEPCVQEWAMRDCVIALAG